MAISVAAKVALTVVKDKKLRKIVGGIILGIIIVIVAPIAILLGVGDAASSIDWNSPEMQQHLMDNMTDEERAKLQAFADTMQAIEDEITAQGLTIEPIKAQVIFLCVLYDREPDAELYTDFISCFADGADDETVFTNLTDTFGVSFTAEEKEKILLLCEKAVESQTVPPGAIHIEIGEMLAGDTTPVSAEIFTTPFRDLDWQACITSEYGKRIDPFTGEEALHSGLDLIADLGTPIYPVKPGTVLFVRYSENGWGHHLAINHGGGQASLYAHCSEIFVAEGDEVDIDTIIAAVGSSGRSTAAHLHIDIVIDGKPVNPKRFLKEAETP